MVKIMFDSEYKIGDTVEIKRSFKGLTTYHQDKTIETTVFPKWLGIVEGIRAYFSRDKKQPELEYAVRTSPEGNPLLIQKERILGKEKRDKLDPDNLRVKPGMAFVVNGEKYIVRDTKDVIAFFETVHDGPAGQYFYVVRATNLKTGKIENFKQEGINKFSELEQEVEAAFHRAP